MPRPLTLQVQVAPSAEATTRGAAQLFSDTVVAAIGARGLARVAISGGSTPCAMFELLANPAEPFLALISWAQLQVFWVDERCVGPEDKESNFGMAKRAMLDHVPLPPANVHRMEGELDPQEGASRYEAALRTAFRLEGAEAPTFDLILLGLGDDGHTASLFPHTAGLHEMSRLVMANHVPQKDTWRLTLTWPVIIEGREVAFLIEGAKKAEMVRTVFAGKHDPETWPAQLIRPTSGRLTLLLDEGAAAELPVGNRSGTSTLPGVGVGSA